MQLSHGLIFYIFGKLCITPKKLKTIVTFIPKPHFIRFATNVFHCYFFGAITFNICRVVGKS